MTWMVRVWLNAWDEECFIDDMHTTEYNFATESEAKMFKDSYNKKFSNYGGWKPHIVRGHPAQFGFRTHLRRAHTLWADSCLLLVKHLIRR